MARPERVFLTIAATAAFVSALAFTIAPLYRFQTAGLDNLQLVLVGIGHGSGRLRVRDPDRHRRRPLVAQVVGRHRPRRDGRRVPRRGGVADVRRRASSARRVWGLAYTFTSGATVAWVAGELGDPSREVLTRLFLRSSRRGSLAALVAVPASYVLGIHVSLRVPIVIGGVVSIGLAVWLAVAMVETPLRAGAVGGPLDVAGDGRVGRGRCCGRSAPATR